VDLYFLNVNIISDTIRFVKHRIQTIFQLYLLQIIDFIFLQKQLLINTQLIYSKNKNITGSGGSKYTCDSSEKVFLVTKDTEKTTI